MDMRKYVTAPPSPCSPGQIGLNIKDSFLSSKQSKKATLPSRSHRFVVIQKRTAATEAMRKALSFSITFESTLPLIRPGTAAWLSFLRITARIMRSLMASCNFPSILICFNKVTRSSTNGSFLRVNVSVTIRSFLEVCLFVRSNCCNFSNVKVDEMRQTLRVMLEMDTTWFDPRLSFKHLQKDASLNVLWRENKDRLWRPKIIFVNINPSDDQRDRNEMFKIVRNPTIPPKILNNTQVFKGSEHAIVRQMEHTHDWRYV